MALQLRRVAAVVPRAATLTQRRFMGAGFAEFDVQKQEFVEVCGLLVVCVLCLAVQRWCFFGV